MICLSSRAVLFPVYNLAHEIRDKDESKHCFGVSMKAKYRLCVHRIEHTMAMHAQVRKEEEAAT